MCVELFFLGRGLELVGLVCLVYTTSDDDCDSKNTPNILQAR